MAQIGNQQALSIGDGLNTILNVDTVNKIVQVLNNASIKLYSDGGATLISTLGGLLGLVQSGTSPDPGGAGTINTANVNVARVNPVAARSGIILQAGTQAGQLCLVVNEAAQGNTLTFNTNPATSNVADSANEAPIDGLSARLFIWDSGTSLWYAIGSPLIGGTLAPNQSATAVAIANNGQIATTGLGVSRLNPAAARTGITMQAGAYPGQLCLVVNEAPTTNFTISFNSVPATANVANSGSELPIAGQTARLFVWDSAAAFWFSVAPLNNGSIAPIQSSSASPIANGGTITANTIGVSRLNPAAAVTGIIIAAGQFPGQMLTVINEAAAANTVTFNTTPATANVADSATEAAIPGLTARTFVWDSSTSLWYRCN